MRSIPRALALGLILVCVLIGAGIGVLVGNRLADSEPTPTVPASAATVAPVGM